MLGPFVGVRVQVLEIMEGELEPQLTRPRNRLDT